MAKLEIELRPDEEQRLTQAAQQRGLSLSDDARQSLLDDPAAPPLNQVPRTAADVLARWQARGLAGAWADRDDIEDSSAYISPASMSAFPL